ncbi:MAG TPA: LPS export ABC transporter periplasmic protein LptC [Burkholderiales bacterium]|nr:LPS export ABC transporter periplasmic protein LptC [Burkholderiales bacterium]
MKFSSARLFPLLLMLALAGLTFWLERTVREEEGVHPSLRRHDPDYIVDNLRHTRYNALGAIESTLVAAKMLHYPDDDTTDLVAPRLVQSKPNEPRMTVTADRGAVSEDGEEVFLYDNVLLVRDGSGENPEARMRTDFLHLVRGKSVVSTDREVVITEDTRRLSGRGMEYHNDSQELFLREHVRGRYEATKRPEAEE